MKAEFEECLQIEIQKLLPRTIVFAYPYAPIIRPASASKKPPGLPRRSIMQLN